MYTLYIVIIIMIMKHSVNTKRQSYCDVTAKYLQAIFAMGTRTAFSLA